MEGLRYLEKVKEKLADTSKDAVVATTEVVLVVRVNRISWVGPLLVCLRSADDGINGPCEGFQRSQLRRYVNLKLSTHVLLHGSFYIAMPE